MGSSGFFNSLFRLYRAYKTDFASVTPKEVLELSDASFIRFILIRVLIPLYRLRTRFFPKKAVLYVGQCYYNTWYLSRALRLRGWKADVLNWDLNPASQIYYHGEDFRFKYAD